MNRLLARRRGLRFRIFSKDLADDPGLYGNLTLTFTNAADGSTAHVWLPAGAAVHGDVDADPVLWAARPEALATVRTLPLDWPDRGVRRPAW